jgi:hypothetical protein
MASEDEAGDRSHVWGSTETLYEAQEQTHELEVAKEIVGTSVRLGKEYQDIVEGSAAPK